MKICQIHTFSEGITVSGTPALSYEIKRNGRLPQVVSVEHEGVFRQFQFGAYVSEKRIVEMLPRLVLDFRTRSRKKAVK